MIEIVKQYLYAATIFLSKWNFYIYKVIDNDLFK